ncbi:glycosyl transferase family 1 [Terrabacter sp. Root85]|uniref:glycosyltransferase n=1 Tax=Terrabacter sp. Root85 TaxID=1736603 RepID=UPI0006F6091A|nr:glycosyltransferase [Terrabacter sp. Root85]KRC92048.1 glycosyl transferase family 1 [Terrabacter sp. Root85]
MRVVILAAARHPIAEPFAGGLESLTWHLVRGLRRQGVDVSFFAGPGSDPALGATPLHVEPLRLSHTARSDASMVPEAWLREHHAYLQVMLALQQRPDVAVVHNNSLHHLPVAMADSLPSPVLTTLHTPPTPWLEPAIEIGARSRNPLRHSHFVAVSEHTARSWAHVTPAHVVHNGVDVDRWVEGPGGEDLVWVGRLVPEKAPHRAIAMARAAGRRLRLAGPVGDADYFTRHVAGELGDDVEYVGHLGTDGLVALVGASAAMLVTPEWDEPYGLVAAESLACGTPVVALDRGGLREFVVPGVGLLLPRDCDDAAAAEAVAAAVDLDRAACRAHAVVACSVDRMVESYLGIYESLSAMSGAA